MATGRLVLLTGATGFIGFRILVLLLRKGYKVRTAVRNAAGFEKVKALKSAAPYASQMEQVIVPDITVPGAYDEAVQGVQYVIHAASPYAAHTLLSSEEYETDYIQPAVAGTVGMLDSAVKESGIKRVVITASVLSIMGLMTSAQEIVVDEKHRSGTRSGPWPNWLFAYSSSKVAALEATEEWMKKNSPTFDLINIEPCSVLGSDETATDVMGVLKGSNYSVLSAVIGQPLENPMPGLPVHVEDVATMHVQALDPSIPGNEDYLACGTNVQWTQTTDIVKKHFPKECEAGILKVDKSLITAPLKVSNAKAKKVFGIEFKSFEEQICDVVGQYLGFINKA